MLDCDDSDIQGYAISIDNKTVETLYSLADAAPGALLIMATEKFTRPKSLQENELAPEGEDNFE